MPTPLTEPFTPSVSLWQICGFAVGIVVCISVMFISIVMYYNKVRRKKRQTDNGRRDLYDTPYAFELIDTFPNVSYSCLHDMNQ